MKKQLTIDIECGINTCAKVPGVFCKYFGTIKFGIIPVCMLFPSKMNSFTILEVLPPDGWAMRCKECLNHEKA